MSGIKFVCFNYVGYNCFIFFNFWDLYVIFINVIGVCFFGVIVVFIIFLVIIIFFVIVFIINGRFFVKMCVSYYFRVFFIWNIVWFFGNFVWNFKIEKVFLE